MGESLSNGRKMSKGARGSSHAFQGKKKRSVISPPKRARVRGTYNGPRAAFVPTQSGVGRWVPLRELQRKRKYQKLLKEKGEYKPEVIKSLASRRFNIQRLPRMIKGSQLGEETIKSYHLSLGNIATGKK